MRKLQYSIAILLLALVSYTYNAEAANLCAEDAGFMVKRVVLDAGHGGKDPGCIGHKHKEKDIALDVTLLVGEMIEAQYPNVEVIYTRQKDEFIPLHERSNIANKARADLFISIHCNSIAGRPHVKGSETFVMGLHRAKDNLDVAKRENASVLLEDNYEEHYEGFDPNSPEGHIALSVYQNAFLDKSISFAQAVEENFGEDKTRSSRGVKQAGFLVLRNTVMPSVLVETGFLSNKEEAKYLASKEGQQRMAESIVKAFGTYKDGMEDENALASKTKSRTVIEEMPASPKKDVAAAASKSKPKVVTSSKKPAISPHKATNQAVVSHSPQVRKQAMTTTTKVAAQQPKVAAAKKVVTSTPSKKPAVTANPSSKNEIKYVVQVAASSKKYIPSGSKWKTIANEVMIRFETERYKYQVGYLHSYEAAEQKKSRLRALGFPDAFVVAYSDDRPISLKEAIAMR